MRHTSSRLKKAAKTLSDKNASKEEKRRAAKILVEHKLRMH